jgi:conjugal transfer pilus assembly protein TraA
MNVFKGYKRRHVVTLAVALGVLAVFMADANAATTGDEFKALYTMLVGWAQGYLGKAMALGAFVIGALIGFARATAMPALIGIVFAILFSVGPGVIDGMLTATI